VAHYEREDRQQGTSPEHDAEDSKDHTE